MHLQRSALGAGARPCQPRPPRALHRQPPRCRCSVQAHARSHTAADDRTQCHPPTIRAGSNAVVKQKGLSFPYDSSRRSLRCQIARRYNLGDVLSDLRCPVRRREPLGVLGRRDAVQQQRLHPLRIPACGAPSAGAHFLQSLQPRPSLTGCSIGALPQWSPVQPLYVYNYVQGGGGGRLITVRVSGFLPHGRTPCNVSD